MNTNTFTGGEDFDGGRYEAFFEAGSTTAQVTIPINDDRKFEGDENFSAQLSIPDGTVGVVRGSNYMATVDITDNEVQTTVNFSPTSYSVSEDGDYATLTLTASAPASHDYTVYVQTSDGTAEGKPCAQPQKCWLQLHSYSLAMSIQIYKVHIHMHTLNYCVLSYSVLRYRWLRLHWREVQCYLCERQFSGRIAYTHH